MRWKNRKWDVNSLDNLDTPREHLTQYCFDPLAKYPTPPPFPLKTVPWRPPFALYPSVSFCLSLIFSPSLTWPPTLSLCGILNLFIIKSPSFLNPYPLPWSSSHILPASDHWLEGQCSLVLLMCSDSDDYPDRYLKCASLQTLTYRSKAAKEESRPQIL